jgi:hypothetical protein
MGYMAASELRDLVLKRLGCTITPETFWDVDGIQQTRYHVEFWDRKDQSVNSLGELCAAGSPGPATSSENSSTPEP